MLQRTLWRTLVTSLTLVAFLLQGTWALAGTTGGLSGNVLDEKGSPVVGARVRASSPSTIVAGTTDGSGHFQFLALPPDTYTLNVDQPGYQAATVSGITVIADQQQSVAVTAPHQLQKIGGTTARSASDIVKPGLTTDVFAVNATQAAAAAVLGGGGSLTSAYSAIAAVPGLVVPTGQSGWNQAVYIRGAKSFDTGYEYDGIPVNRAFDNYDAGTASSLGQQQLQVYTGGGPASVASAGIGGFINQVVRTGTYPAVNTLTVATGGPAAYRQAGLELGGATATRSFSYYLGIAGHDQNFRYFDPFNGGPGNSAYGPLATYSPALVAGFTGQGVYPVCDPATGNPMNVNTAAPGAASGCFYPYNGLLQNLVSTIQDRENVANLHFSFPRKNGLKDDLQLLGGISMQKTIFYGSPNDLGNGSPNGFMLANGLGPYDPVNNFPTYIDATVYNVPFGSPIRGVAPSIYYQPDSPSGRALNAPLPLAARYPFYNDTGVIKAQYTHNFSDRAYARLMGYTFFSDWTQQNPTYAFTAAAGFGIATSFLAYDYKLITHTAGTELQFADQLNDQHLLQFTTNFARANVVRFNNTGFLAGASPTGLVARNGGVFTCYRGSDGAAVPCLEELGAAQRPGFPSARGTALNPCPGTSGTCAVTGAAAAAGAQWVSLWDGNADGTYNTVGPRFLSSALTDEWKPTQKLTLNFGLKFDRFQYNLANTQRAANDFYTQIVQNYGCYNPATLEVTTAPLSPTAPPPQNAVFTTTCPAGFQHIGSQFTDVSPKSYVLQMLEPRFSFAYAQSPDTVVRGSIGRFVSPPISASVQYDRRAGTVATSLATASFVPLGFFTPFHAIPPQSATNADASFEHRFHGSDVSLKISPYYRYTSGWQQQVIIGPNFVSQLPVGDSRDYGFEFSLHKGDFNRNGFSGLLSYTYTHSRVTFKDEFGAGSSQLDRINNSIAAYNALTTESPCYTPATYSGAALTAYGAPTSCATAGAIKNPYFGQPAQPLVNTGGQYVPYAVSLAVTGVGDIGANNQFTYPHSISGILNWRRNKLAITPSFQFQSGNFYGSPIDVAGIDPRACGANQLSGGAVGAGSPFAQNPDFRTCNAPAVVAGAAATIPAGEATTPGGYLYIPNPLTGSFDSIGKYQNPSILTLNMAVSYDVSSRVKVNLTLANLFHSCFGGSQMPWTNAGSRVCGYLVNPYYPANFYNGSSVNDVATNGTTVAPALRYPFAPSVGTVAANQPFPFSAFFTVSVKL
ncbi:MAG: hypothetical protein JWM87_633 [Candidatus Eremiobacteraeota bacterium]|nr:hypothetical protein [Candidatus Eremiobacteraeota bacterium]